MRSPAQFVFYQLMFDVDMSWHLFHYLVTKMLFKEKWSFPLAFSFLLFILFSICPVFAQENNWTSELDIGSQYANHPSTFISENHSLTLIGGAVERNSSRKSLKRSLINSSGELGFWENISSSELIYPLIWHSLLRHENNLYVLGGFNEVNSPNSYFSTDATQRSVISGDGTISQWALLGNSLPDKLAKGGSVVIGDNIYYSGGGLWLGYSGPSVKAIIYMSALQVDGSLGVWSNAGSLPHPMMGHQLFYTGSKLYLISGYNADSGVADGKVYLANINSDGSIGGWTEQTTLELPLKTYDYMTTRSGDYLIVAGGRGPNRDDPRTYDAIYFSKVESDGTLGVWQESRIKLPKTLCCAGLASNGTRVYLTGGHDGHDYFSNVWSILAGDITQTDSSSGLNPVVFIPGMGASWNHDALIENASVPNEGWSLAPYAKDTYEGLLLSLQSAGYINNDTLFVYNYDWRRDVRFNAGALKDYINTHMLANKSSDAKVDLVGHSMGGLIARVAATGDFSTKVDKVIALGSPYNGTVVAYNAWEGAEFSGFTGAMRIGIQTLVGTAGHIYKSPVNFVQTNIPSFQNILPGWDFLKGRDFILKPNSVMAWQNNLISEMSQDIPNKLGTIGGLGNDTQKYLIVGKQTIRDLSMGRWVDGRPSAQENSNGDDTTLIESLQVPGSWKSDALENTNHGQLCSESAGQRKVLEYLGVAGTEVVTYPRLFHRAIIVTLGSPAEFSVVAPSNQEFYPEDKILALDDPISGTYKVKLKSTGQGKATVYFGRINSSDMAWSDVEVKFDAAGSEKSFEFPVDFSRSDLGAKPLEEIVQCFMQIGPDLKKLGFSNHYFQLDGLLRLLRGVKAREKMTDRWVGLVLNGIDDLIGKLKKVYPENSEVIFCLNKAKIKIDQYASDLAGD